MLIISVAAMTTAINAEHIYDAVYLGTASSSSTAGTSLVRGLSGQDIAICTNVTGTKFMSEDYIFKCMYTCAYSRSLVLG
jgi:hypothetical protein